MAKEVFKDAVVFVNGVNLSDHFHTITVEATADEIDFTGFTSAGFREIGSGLKTASVAGDAFQDYAGTSVHATLEPLFTGGSTFSLYVNPHIGSTSTTNPRGSMTARILTYTGIGGAVGDAAVTTCTFVNAGTAGSVWSTA